MKYPVYSIRDVKVGFDPTFLVQSNDDAAVRAFEVAINNPGNSVMNYRPSDFELYKIGDFEVETGQFESCPVAQFIIGGVDVAKS